MWEHVIVIVIVIVSVIVIVNVSVIVSVNVIVIVSVNVSVRTASSAMGVAALNLIGKRFICYCIDSIRFAQMAYFLRGFSH